MATDQLPAGTDTAPHRAGSGETFAGVVLVGWSALAAFAVHVYPQQNGLDRLGFEWIAKSPDSTFYLRIADMGSAAALAVGSILAALICIRRDRWRALACVAGPLLCALSVEYVLKPLVARRFEGVLSYPSGNTADVAAFVTAWVLAVPSRIRPFFVVIGGIAVGAMVTTVIGLRWHYPSDALAGVALGVGVVLLVDGLLHLWAGRDRVPRSGHRDQRRRYR